MLVQQQINFFKLQTPPQDVITVDAPSTTDINWNNTAVIFNTYLDSIDLVATTWGGLCCKSCGVAFPPAMMLNHLKAKDHKFDKIVIDEVQFKAALETCNILSQLPNPPTSLVSQVAGLMLHDGFICSFCSTMTSTKESMDRHTRDHKDKTLSQSYQSCQLQRFNGTAGAVRTWFQVQMTSPPAHTRSILDQFLMDVETQLGKTVYDPTASNDPRTVSPWLLTTKWHEELKGKDITTLCETVKTCKNWKNLHKATTTWIHSLKTLEITVDKNI